MELFPELMRQTISSLSEKLLVDFAICKLKEAIDCKNIHSNRIKKTGTVFKELLCNNFLCYNFFFKA